MELIMQPYCKKGIMGYKSAFDAAIEHLIRTRKIEKAEDLERILGIRSNTISTYRGGKTPLPKKHSKKFEEYFRIKLSDFSSEVEPGSRAQNDPYVEKYNTLLEEFKQLQASHIELMKSKDPPNLDAILEQLRANTAYLATLYIGFVQHRQYLEKQGKGKVLGDMDKILSENFQKYLKTDSD